MKDVTQQKMTDLERLIGTWRLISSTQYLPNGQVLQVFDEGPLGYFIFTPEGIMSVQIMRLIRTNPQSSDHLLKDYLAYTGRFTVNSEEKIINIQVETSLSPNYLGKQLKRSYEIDNHQLKLKALESKIDHVITWERVSS